MEMTELEYSKQRVFDLALQIARLQLYSCYLEGEQLILLSGDGTEPYIVQFRHELEHEAKSVLMRGTWK